MTSSTKVTKTEREEIKEDNFESYLEKKRSSFIFRTIGKI